MTNTVMFGCPVLIMCIYMSILWYLWGNIYLGSTKRESNIRGTNNGLDCEISRCKRFNV